jgi:hypothetical protein
MDSHLSREQFDAGALCSRKLWELVSDSKQTVSERELQQAISELAARRRYLQELQQIGKLKH